MENQVKSNKQENKTSKIEKVKQRYDEFISSVEEVFTKVDKRLMLKLLETLRENPQKLPLCTIEVFTRPGTDQDAATRMIASKTGKIPGVYDRGTHYVTDQRISLEILAEISADPDVVAIKGEFIEPGTASRGPSHDV